MGHTRVSTHPGHPNATHGAARRDFVPFAQGARRDRETRLHPICPVPPGPTPHRCRHPHPRESGTKSRPNAPGAPKRDSRRRETRLRPICSVPPGPTPHRCHTQMASPPPGKMGHTRIPTRQGHPNAANGALRREYVPFSFSDSGRPLDALATDARFYHARAGRCVTSAHQPTLSGQGAALYARSAIRTDSSGAMNASLALNKIPWSRHLASRSGHMGVVQLTIG